MMSVFVWLISLNVSTLYIHFCFSNGENQFLWLYVSQSIQLLSCVPLCNPMNCSTPGFPVHHQFPELAQTHVHQVGDDIQPSHPLSSLLLPPSIFPRIRVFSKESILCIRWPKCWSFNFSISPSKEYLGLISFRTDWLQEIPKGLSSSPRDSQESSPTP